MRTKRITFTGSMTAPRVLVAIAVLFAAAACAPPPPSQAPAISSFQALGAPHVEPALVPVTWTVSDPQGDALTCQLDSDGDGAWDETLDPCPAAASRNATSVGAGTHTARLEVSDGTHTTVASTTYTVAAPTSAEDFDIVIRPWGPVPADVLAALEWGASRWENSIARGLSDIPVTLAGGLCGTDSNGLDEVVDDLVVNVSMKVIPPAAWASSCVYGPDNLPRVGFIEFNPDLVANLRTLGVIDEVALHELGHVLGFGVLWQPERHLIANPDSTDPRFIGPRALAEYSVLGRAGGGIPIMTIDGVIQPHWESAFFEEIMARVPDGAPLSRMTLASMADLGYAVDLDAADPYTPSLPAGSCIEFSAEVVRCW